MKLSLVIDELVEERGLDRELLSTVICEGMLAAYEKKYPELTFSVEHNKKTDELEVKVEKRVVSSVQDEDIEISLRKARNIDPKTELGGEVWVQFDGKIGRIEIIRAKQVIANKIRSIEAAAVYSEFIGKIGTIVLGTIHKCERAGMTIKVGDALAFLPKSLSMPSDKCIVGYSIRALLKDVLNEPRNDNQLILDRSSASRIESHQLGKRFASIEAFISCEVGTWLLRSIGLICFSMIEIPIRAARISGAQLSAV